jgi:HK97 family phage major capsid protein
MKRSLEEITEAISGVETKLTEALEAAEEDRSKAPEFKALIEGTDEEPGLKARLEALEAERDDALREEEFKAMKGEFGTLKSAIEELRKEPAGRLGFGDSGETDEEGKALAEGDKPYAEGKASFFADVHKANKGITTARERLTDGIEVPSGFEGKALTEEGKAMTEGVQAQGGYLVRPVIERQLVEARELDNVLRPLCSKLNITTNSLQLDQLGIATTAGWVAELAQKPETTSMSLASITASIFAAAGLVTVSNQLLADSNPAIDQLVLSDLRKRLVALEETAFINGTGSGQPLGILNTPGISATALTGTTAQNLVDAILDSIAQVQTDHGNPTAILMHPRTWTFILKAKDTNGAWLLSPSATDLRAPFDNPRTVYTGPQKSLWGIPVVTSNRVPVNLGAGTNESRVIVGDFSEALILDRQGITVDESSHVFFTTNQTVFRAEERVGFTAARTPLAFNVVGGAGLANH